MKIKLVIPIAIAVIILMTACQPGQLLGPQITPTPTLEQAYCRNQVMTIKEKVQFSNASDKLIQYLNSPVHDVPSFTNQEYLDFLQPAVANGLITFEEPILDDAIPVFSNYHDAAVKLQIALNREVVPPKMEFVHSKIMSCIDQSIEFGLMYIAYIQDKVPLTSTMNFSSCNETKVYYDEIQSFCDNQK